MFIVSLLSRLQSFMSCGRSKTDDCDAFPYSSAARAAAAASSSSHSNSVSASPAGNFPTNTAYENFNQGRNAPKFEHVANYIYCSTARIMFLAILLPGAT
jgi:hypothetical protein